MRTTLRRRHALWAAALLTPLSGQTTDVPEAASLLQKAQAKIGTGPLPQGLGIRGSVRAVWITTSHSTPFGQGTFEQLHGADGRRLLTIRLPGIGTYAWGSDGKTSWRIEPVAGATFRAGRDAIVDTLLSSLFVGRVKLRKHYAAAVTKQTRRGERTVFELHMRRDEPKADVWFVDKGLGLPTGAVLQATDGLGQSRMWTIEMADWKAHDKRRYPHSLTFREGHLELHLSTTEIKTGEKPDAARFRLGEAARKNAEHRAADAEKKLAKAKAPLIRIQRLAARHALVIRAKVKPSEISLTLARILPKVMEYVNHKGVKAVGAPFSIYHSFSANGIELEAGIPVAEATAGKGEIRPLLLPAGEAAITWHVGPYHELGQTHQRLQKWIAKRGLATDGPLSEYYWTDPGLEPNPRRWRTEMIWPVKRAAK